MESKITLTDGSKITFDLAKALYDLCQAFDEEFKARGAARLYQGSAASVELAEAALRESVIRLICRFPSHELNKLKKAL
jgi:hypothetical protein